MANRYVDFSAANNGDGTTAAQAASPGGVGAYNTIVGITPVDGDSYWIRRSGTLTLVATYTLSVGAKFIGWPISGDTYYTTRPASGTSNGWDADTQTYAQVTCSTINLGDHYLKISGTNADIQRMKWTMTAGTQTTGQALCSLGSNCTINNCYFLNTANGAATMYGIQSSGSAATCLITNTTIEFSAILTSTNTYTLLYCNGVGNSAIFQFFNCIFTLSNPGNSATSGITNINANMGAVATLILDTCTIIRNGIGAACDLVTLANAVAGIVNAVYMYNCTLTDQVMASSTILNTGANLGIVVCSRLNGSGGRISLGKAGHYCHFSRFAQSNYSTDYAVQMVAGATFVCNNFLENAGNISGAINGQVNCNIILQNAQMISTLPFGPVASIIANIYETDSRGIYGYFKYTRPVGTITASSVVRVGGETFSLLFFPTSGGLYNLQQFRAMIQSFETIFAALTPASTTVTIYGAYKGYSPAPDNSQIWAECDYIDVATGSRRTYVSTARVTGGALTADGSTWTGDSGLTGFKLVLPVAALQNCLAPIRIYTNLSQVTAYFYIDPIPVVA